jgi:hypothetical protein
MNEDNNLYDDAKARRVQALILKFFETVL